jgi:hypothetical protein
MKLLNIATKGHVDGFAHNWKHRGILHILTDVHKQFALDFANMIVTSFVEDQMNKAQAAAEKAKVVLTEA